MNAFFFGRSERSLFGVYHPPQGKTDRKAGIVLCCPMGQEYMRSHRAFRQLANLLSRKGYHVLRFDWFGTGDSMGGSSEFSVRSCLDDLDVAIMELRDNAELEQVSLVGLCGPADALFTAVQLAVAAASPAARRKSFLVGAIPGTLPCHQDPS